MGHYDDQYEAEAERSTKSRNKWNAQQVNECEDSLDEATGFIEQLEITDEYKQHLLQKTRELRALVRFYTRS